jgi:hypothetical protein
MISKLKRHQAINISKENHQSKKIYSKTSKNKTNRQNQISGMKN